MTQFVGQGSSLTGRLTRQHASEVAGLAAAAIAGAALAGWWTGVTQLANWGLSFTVMKPVVACCLAVLGLALVQPGKDRRFAFVAGVVVTAVAVLLLCMGLFASERGVAGWLAGPAASPFQGALPLGFAGASLALSRFARCRNAATVLAGVAGAMAVFALLGHLSGVDMLHGSKRVALPSLPTTAALICIVCGIILRTGKMPALRTPRPLWHLLLALGCATVAPLLLFGAYAGNRMAEAQLDQVRKELQSEARAVSATIDRQVVSEIETLQALAASPSLRQGDFAAFQHQAEAALAVRRSGAIALVDRNMAQLVNTWVPYGSPMPRAVIQESVERAFATGKTQFSGLFMGSVTRQLHAAIIVPVVIGGENRYALVGTPNREAFASLVAAAVLPPGWQAAVTDAQHRVLAKSEPGKETGGMTLPAAQQQDIGISGIFEFTDVDGQPSLEAYARSELTGWVTAVWQPVTLLTAPVQVLWRTLGWLALLAVVLLVAVALSLGGLIAGSVGQAARAAAALGEGRPLPSSETPVAEINTLMAELRTAAMQRQAAEDRLRESEATFRAMFDQSSVAKIEVVPENGRFLRANAAMCKFVGYSEAELLDLTVWDITHPEERERDREPIRRLLNGEAAGFDVEKRYIRKDGTPVWAHTVVNIFRDQTSRPVRSIAVIEDIDARKRAERALQASKDRLELALDAARLGSWQYDARQRVFTGDARSNEIFGFDIARMDEVPIDEVLQLVHPDDVEMVLKAMADALSPANPMRTVTMFRLRGRYGEIRWVETLGQGYFEGAGSARRGVRIVGTCQDITARKEREEKEQLLMREINHRAKNMLSVVHAIAHQTATRNPADFIDRFSERIQALSANQDLLVRNEWNGVEITDLVQAQLAHFVGLIGSRIAMRGPRLRLNAATAQAIGLALHELATNAGKYGALSTSRGRVDIGWSIDGAAFAMSWAERDGPTVSAPARRGFGSLVMGVMAERSVGGKVDTEYAPSGVWWRLVCPAANALEARERDEGPEEDHQTVKSQIAKDRIRKESVAK